MRGHPTIQRPLRVAHVRVLRLDRELVLQKALQALVVGTELLKIDVAAAVLVDTLELVGDVVCDLVLGYTEMMEIHLDDHIRHLHQRDLAVAVAIVLVKDLADTRGLVLRLGDCGQVQPRRSGLGEWCVETGTGEGGGSGKIRSAAPRTQAVVIECVDRGWVHGPHRVKPILQR